MNPDFVISKRLLYSTLFGIVIICGALYLANKEKKQFINTNLADNQSATETVSSVSTSAVVAPSQGEANNAMVQTLDGVPITETDILTRNVLKPYLDQNNAGTYSTESGERIIQEATEAMFILDYTPLDAQDILTTEDTSKTSVLQYKQDLYTAIKPIFNLTEYELTIYARAVRDNSKEEFDSLLTIANVYSSAGDGALTTHVPTDVSAVHLDIINSLYKFSTVLKTLAIGFDDPAASLAGTGNFTIAEDELQQAFSQLQTYFILKEVGDIVI